MLGYVCHGAHALSEDKFLKSVLSFHLYESSMDQTQVALSREIFLGRSLEKAEVGSARAPLSMNKVLL